MLLVALSAVGLAACGSVVLSPEIKVSAAPSTSIGLSAPAASGNASSSAVQSSGTARIDACALLPSGLLSGVLGGEVAFPKATPNGGWASGQCAWNGSTSSFIVRVGTTASIMAFGDPAAADAKTQFEQFKRQTSSPKTVPGIGDGAVLTANGMAAYKKDTYVEITKLRLTDEQLISIMGIAIANL